MEIKKGTFCSQNIFKFFLFSFPASSTWRSAYVCSRQCWLSVRQWATECVNERRRRSSTGSPRIRGKM